ncbi:hypothetical protein [Bradyrhizobium sp. 2TAF24]|uniref:hypothetical protein n=1 Tax=Bradyrhizobium sp. 2TAF24 TaxID=3233011 RepID=UPI003F8EE897
MAILGLSQFKYTTDWTYETSEDTSVGLIGTYSTGTVVLSNNATGDEMRISYKALSCSLSKGLPFGITKSHFTDPSGGVGPVCSNRYFDSMCFPCRGYILSAGATFGESGEVLAKIFDMPPPKPGPNGGGASIFYFGAWPFAGFRCWGQFTATTPGGGLSAALAGFGIAD